jgi:hypothetical protein
MGWSASASVVHAMSIPPGAFGVQPRRVTAGTRCRERPHSSSSGRACAGGESAVRRQRIPAFSDADSDLAMALRANCDAFCD